MVFNFLRGGPSGLETVQQDVITMLGHCRHTFDLAMAALDAGPDIQAFSDDVHATDERINALEEEVRRRLVVHVAVHGAEHVGRVMGDLLIVKKLERVGDQHKNILDLAEEGVRLSGAPDHAELHALRQEVSEMFATAADVLATGDEERAQALGDRATELRQELEARIREMVHSDQPASHAVPRALLFRYLKRIVANLAGVAMTVKDGIERIERDSAGEDIDD